ncbi:MAG: hypothetical protein KAT70_01420 [Thermoplasmata archaeon]|nr:hypothetical protein [Thermoplasmata archaeon]
MMRTTVIGSYPAGPSPGSLMESYHADLSSNRPDPYLAPMKEAVMAQLKAGIDIVSDGQTRDGMVEAFVKKLGGTRFHGKAIILDEIEHRGAITLEDLEYARGLLPPGRGLKGIITGPYTLATACEDQHYGSLEKAAFAFAHALHEEALAIRGVVDIIQVDEPFFTGEYPSYGKELVETVLGGLDVPTAIHVCGDVSNFFEDLVEYDVDILEHEFAAHPELLDVIKEYDFPQTLGFGSVRSDSDVVESPEQILEHVARALQFFSPEKLVLSPDCGLRHLPPSSAYDKLHNLVVARDRLSEEGV